MIHQTAIVDPTANLADDVVVGPYSIIGAHVEIGSGSDIGPHVVINGPTRMGEQNKIYQFASIGDDPQDKKYAGEQTLLEIGNGNTIREYTTINRGTEQGGGVTKVGNDNWIMAYSHIAHDCIVGDNAIFANAASIAGHVSVGNYAIIGAFTCVHQFCSIGPYSFSALGTVINKDIPPYVMASGSPAQPHGLNSEGLKRHGFTSEVLQSIKKAYKLLYKSNLKLEEAISQIEDLATECTELNLLIEFLKNSQRGIIR